MNDHNHDPRIIRDLHAGMTPEEVERVRKELQFALDNPDKVIFVGDTFDVWPEKEGL